MKAYRQSKQNIGGLKIKTLGGYIREKYPTAKAKKVADERLKRLSLGYEIYSGRINRKLTQKDLAEKIQTTQSEVARIESGDQNITYDKLVRIVRALKKEIRITP